MPKRIVFGTELREACSKTMVLLDKGVGASLGPSGKLALMDRGEKIPSLISKDGVTICKFMLPIKDEIENLIAGKILEIANKTNAESGDGTTTSIVLANALFEEAVKWINTKNIDPVVVRDEIEKTLPVIMAELDKRSVRISTFEEMKAVATISANNDSAIGELIAKAIDSVGQDGFVTLSEGEREEPTLTLTEGYQIPKGPATTRYLNGKVVEEFVNPRYFIIDGRFEVAEVLNNLYCNIAGQPFVVIGDLSETCQQWMLNNSRLGQVACVHIIPPFRKEARLKVLQDIAAVVGATIVDPLNFNFAEEIPARVLGKSNSITFNKYHTNIIEGSGDKKQILQRIETLKSEMEGTRSTYEKDIIKGRIGSLTGGTAVLGVGGRTDDEVLERKDRFEDALNATRSSLESGVVAGGGFTLFQIAQKLKAKTIGERIFKIALEAPMRKIIANTGLDVEEVVERVRKSKKGYDAKTHKLVDLVKVGIIDPLKSTKSGLKNAVSIVDLLINLEVCSVNCLESENIRDMMQVMKNLKDE